MIGPASHEIARALDLRRGRGTCPVCGNRDTLVLLTSREGPPRPFCHYGCDSAEVRRATSRICDGGWHHAPPPIPRDGEAKHAMSRDRATKLWQGSVPATNTLAARYLALRGLAGLERSEAIRFRYDTPHPSCGRYPAMLAVVTGGAGQPCAVHRTYLAGDGRKAAVDPPKASLGPIWGGAIRLDPVAPELVIGEGIETAASAGRLLVLPAWAAINAGNLARGLVLPDEVRSVVIAADRDVAGEQAADEAAQRWQGQGRRVRIARPSTGDFNDVLLARETNDAA